MTTPVTISERAARRISQILKDEGDGAMLRISVEGGGCSGFQYKFDVDHAQAEDDVVIARDSAVVLVDPASATTCSARRFACTTRTPPPPAAAVPVSRSKSGVQLASGDARCGYR